MGAVEQGRLVYGNLKKVILYLFATSLAEVLVLLLALAGGFPLPLAAVQILWINIVTEGTVTVNLVMDPPDGDEMKRAPVPRNDRLLSRETTAARGADDADHRRRHFRLVCLAAGPGLARTPGAHRDLHRARHVCQWFNVLNCESATRSSLRLRRGLLKNPWLLGGLSLSVLLQAVVVYLPAMNGLFHTVPLAPSALMPLLGLASTVLWAEELRKLGVRTRQSRLWSRP